MLPAAVGLLNGTSLGGGSYSVDVFFQDGAKAKFVRVGDTVQDNLSNQYQITTWSVFPSDFVSGGTMTVSFITTDTAPATSGGFDSSVFTPGQVDVRPAMKTSGTIGSSAIFSGQDFEYTVSAAWDDGVEAALAVVGDSIVDSEGKEFEITFIDPGGFSQPFRVKEVVAEGQGPFTGAASLYRATVNYEFFQGTPITDPARTVVRGRDDFIIDSILKSLQDQITAGGGSSSGVTATLQNNTGSTIIKGTPVRVNSSGDIEPIDVSVEDEVLASIGLASEDITTGGTGTVVTAGKIEDVTTTATFDDLIYVSKAGQLTNTKPDIGVDGFVAGDFVIAIGVIIKNDVTPAQKDLVVNIQTIGQL
jgi:hypothetical protein